MIPAPADVTSPPADATVTASGLAYRILEGPDSADKPASTDKVTVHYTGWTAATGDMFDSSILRGEPATFGLNQVIKGWTEGLQLMATGQKARFWIPGDLAYGNEPQGGRPHGLLVFDVELQSITPGPKMPEVPTDVASAPADATITASGLAYKVLSKGSGSEQPSATSTVTVHYTGWTAATGDMFDSSVMRDKTISFPLNRVIPGWTEGLQLMVAGEKARFWIPGNLAYGDVSQGGRPHGTLVFDVELFSFT
jgi:FKBP-type peptidyl-prolyl cis-trans isomerase